MKKTIIAIGLLGAFGAQAEVVHHFDYSNGQAVDLIGGASTYTVGVTSTVDRFGNANSAFFFDGDSAQENYIESDISVLPTSTFSVWARLDAYVIDTTSERGALFSTGVGLEGFSGNLFFDLETSWGCEEKLLWNSGNGCVNTFDGTDNVVQNIIGSGFKHYVVVTDELEQKVSLYIDGVFYNDSTYYHHVDSPVFTVGSLYSGIQNMDPYNMARYDWNGVVDDVSIVNGALNASQVQELYQVSVVGGDDIGYLQSLTLNASNAQSSSDVSVPVLSSALTMLGFLGFRRKQNKGM